ncbi:MAG: hypothetical protein QOG17_1397, partial [Gammaproteobacteria bacterium]|nr:hypothetical protein [Gammaproteobacteria bacterium]
GEGDPEPVRGLAIVGMRSAARCAVHANGPLNEALIRNVHACGSHMSRY